jgi:hypothetical protein
VSRISFRKRFVKNPTPDPVVPIHFRKCLQHTKHLYPSGSVQTPEVQSM